MHPAPVVPLIALAANDVDAAGLSLDVELPVAWLSERAAEADGTATAPGRFSGRLSRSGRADIVVRGRVKASVDLPCARCLKPVGIPIDTEIALLLKPRAAHEAGKASGKSNGKPAGGPTTGDTSSKKAKRRKAAEPEYEFSAEEADVDTYDGERVVLDGFVREAILLELPSFPLCSEACPGIGDAASEGLPGLSPAPAPAESRTGSGKPNPFEALRHLLSAEGADDGGGEPARRPSPAEVRRVSRAKSRAKPKIRSSMASRTKK